VTDPPQNAVKRKQADVSAFITRLLKPFLNLLPLTRRRRPVTPTPPEVLGIGLGSAFFPREGSGR
jgi:hypothetical protein